MAARPGFAISESPAYVGRGVAKRVGGSWPLSASTTMAVHHRCITAAASGGVPRQCPPRRPCMV